MEISPMELDLGPIDTYTRQIDDSPKSNSPKAGKRNSYIY